MVQFKIVQHQPLIDRMEDMALGDQWMRAAVQWQVVALYAIAAGYESLAASIERKLEELQS
jgi:hypothetical protein